MEENHNNKLLSVILPVYNREQSLKRAAEAVLSQSYEPIELIIVDDGSTDGTAELCRRLSEDHADVTALRKENGGPSSARNLGLKTAKGEYIAFMDSDDGLDPHMYERLIRSIEESGADIALCGFDGVDTDIIAGKSTEAGTNASAPESRENTSEGDSEKTGHIGAKERRNQESTERLGQSAADGTFTDKKEDMLELLTDIRRGFGWGVWNKVYKRELLSGLEFDESLRINEDLDFNIRAFLKASAISYTEARLYHYNKENEGLSKAPDIKRYLNAMEAIEELLSPDMRKKLGEGASANLESEILNQGLMAAEVLLLTGKLEPKDEDTLRLRRMIRKHRGKGAEKRLRIDQKPLLSALMRNLRLYKAVYYGELPAKLLLGGGDIYKRIKRRLD